MRHRVAILLTVAAVVVLGTAAAVVVGRVQQAPVYTVAALAARVQQHPQAWVGRTLRVRGLVLPVLDPSCTLAGASCFQLLLRDGTPLQLRASPAGAQGAGAPTTPPVPRPGPALAVVPGGTDPLLTRLRRLPLLAAFVPRPQVVDSTGARVYTLRLERWSPTSSSCAALSCYRGVLLDAAPIVGQVMASP